MLRKYTKEERNQFVLALERAKDRLFVPGKGFGNNTHVCNALTSHPWPGTKYEAGTPHGLDQQHDRGVLQMKIKTAELSPKRLHPARRVSGMRAAGPCY
jgi:hypothetical protein